MTEEELAALVTALNGAPGDLLLFAADQNKIVWNVLGALRLELAKELDFPFRRNGSLVVCLHEEDLPKLQGLYDKGVKNGVKGLRILSKQEAQEIEPNLAEDVAGALYAPTGGIVCPFLMTIALAENANTNGV